MDKEIVYRVQENPDYIRDINTGAVLNTNVSKLRDYKVRKRQDRKIEDLKSELAELKALLRVVLEGQKCQ